MNLDVNDEKAGAKKIFVFAGTSCARRLIESYTLPPTPYSLTLTPKITAFTATDYGAALLAKTGCEVRAGRLDAAGMKAALETGQPDFVVDAAHPYAVEARANIKAACAAAGARYLRLSRDTGEAGGDVRLGSAEEAAAFLREREGVIFLATGINEAARFAPLRERVVLRVLPMDESLKRAADLGFAAKNIIAMQGPFSEDLNAALFRKTRAAWLVTKQSGEAGGFDAKLRAARACGVCAIVISPPEDDDGHSLEEILQLTGCKITAPSLNPQPHNAELKILNPYPVIHLVSAGTGDHRLMTALAREALEASECVIGAHRLLESCAALIAGKESTAMTDASKIMEFIGQSKMRVFAVLLSGDGGFYSLAKTLLPKIREKGWRFYVHPGVSSLALLAARLGVSWDDVITISLHSITGGDIHAENLIVCGVMKHKKVFFLTNSVCNPAFICKTLCKHGLGGVLVSSGGALSLPEEQIRQGSAADLADAEFNPLNAVLVENSAPAADADVRSIPDGAFTRGKVPMTKAEVRLIAISRLSICQTDIVWDVGAGTGAVSCEAALFAGRVFAIEQKKEALNLIAINSQALGANNLEIVEGIAPEALLPLPPPDAVFIGGANGRLNAIIDVCLAKNPRCRFAATAVTLETIAELQALRLRSGICNIEITELAVSRATEAGSYHLLKAENPVFIASFEGKKP